MSASVGLPRMDLFAVADRAPVAVWAGCVYLVVATGPSGQPRLTVGENDYALAPAGTLEAAESRYFRLHRSAVETLKVDYLRGQFHAALEQADELRRRALDTSIMAFLVHEVVPRLEQMAGAPAGRQVEPVLSERRWRAAALERLLASSEAAPSARLLPSIVGDSLILDGHVQRLVRARPGDDVVLQVADRRLAPRGPARPLPAAERRFEQEARDLLHRTAIEESPERLECLEQIRHERRRLALAIDAAAVAPGEHLFRNHVGGVLRRASGSFAVYLEVPEYVVEDSDGSLYRFDATRAAVSVASLDPSGVLGGAFVLSPTEHMFVSADELRICMVYPTGYLESLRKNLLEGLFTLLFDAKMTLMAGHHADNRSNPFRAITSFEHRRITRDSAMQRQLPIFPYHRR